MKKLLSLLLVIPLSGCLPSPDPEVYSEYCGPMHDVQYDIVGQSGLYVPVNVDGVRMAQDLFVKDNAIEKLYYEIEACMGVPATPGPEIWFTSLSRLGLGSPWGATIYANQLIAINTDITEFNQRNCISDVDTLRHEYIHYIAYMNGLQSDHGSPYFEQCDAVGVKTCNGVPCR